MIRANHNTSTAYADSLPEAPPGLFELWQLLRRQLRWIVAGAVVGIALGGAYCHFAKPVYQSEAIILVDKKNPQLPQVTAEGQATEMSVEEADLATLLAILQTGTNLVEDALRDSGMDKAPSVLAELDDDQSPAEYVQEHLEVIKGADGAARLAHTLKITFRHTDASDCETILKALIERYRDFVNDMQKRPIEQALQVASDNYERAQKKLDRLQTESDAFLETTELAWSGQEATNMHRELAAQYEMELDRIRRERIELESQLLELVDNTSTKSDVERLASIAPEDLKPFELLMDVYHQGDTTRDREANLLLQLQMERDHLLIRFAEDHPRVRKNTLAIQRIEKRQTEEKLGHVKPAFIVQTYVRSLQTRLAELNVREQRFAAQQNREINEAKKLVRYETKHQQMRLGLDRQIELVGQLDARIRDVTASLEYDGFINEFIKSAELGENVSPKLALMLAVGLILGAGFGTCIGVIREQSRTPVQPQPRNRSASRLATERSRFEMTV